MVIEYYTQNLPFPLPLILLLVGCLGMPLFGLLSEKNRSPRIRDFWLIFITTVSLASIYVSYGQISAATNNILVFKIWDQTPPLGGCFEVDMLGVFMVFSISLLGFFVAIYSTTYMKGEKRLTEFYTLLILTMAGMTGVVLAGDMLTLFIFWEIMSITSYVLVSFFKGNWGGIEAGFKYLIMSSMAGAFILLSMSLIYGMTGTLNFASIASTLRGADLSPWMILLFGTLVIGFGVKSAIVPMHTWLPDAYSEAPDPVSSLLAGIATETALFALTRVLYIIFEPGVFMIPIAILALITMTFGNIMALRQDNVKRLLAYSSIAQIGYIMIGVSSGIVYGLLGAFLHIFNHALMKGMAFLAVGNIVKQTGKHDVSQMQGLGKVMPYTSLAITVAMLGLGGVPGTSGFISKFVLFSAALGAGQPILAIVGVLNAALSMAYYLKVIMTLYSGNIPIDLKVKEAPFVMIGITSVIAIIIVVFGFYPNPILEFASNASKALIDGRNNYIGAVLH